jgi:hypothetical protein
MARTTSIPLVTRPNAGIAAAQAIAFTTTDPGARTPPWTLQSNPRRCVVDTDGLPQDEDELSNFKGATYIDFAVPFDLGELDRIHFSDGLQAPHRDCRERL